MRTAVYTPPPFEDRVLALYNAAPLSEKLNPDDLPVDWFHEPYPEAETNNNNNR